MDCSASGAGEDIGGVSSSFINPPSLVSAATALTNSPVPARAEAQKRARRVGARNVGVVCERAALAHASQRVDELRGHARRRDRDEGPPDEKRDLGAKLGGKRG